LRRAQEKIDDLLACYEGVQKDGFYESIEKLLAELIFSPVISSFLRPMFSILVKGIFLFSFLVFIQHYIVEKF
jgi:uncharacterized membrane protein (DUF106 family)